VNFFWSRRTEDYGTVPHHADEVWLLDVDFVVQESGREKTVEEGVKNVHAFARDKLLGGGPFGEVDTTISYQPFKRGSFVALSNDRAVSGTGTVRVKTSGVTAREVVYE